MTAYLLMQDREILAKSMPVDLARDSLMHGYNLLHDGCRASAFAAHGEALML
jgi:hypothetical protein